MAAVHFECHSGAACSCVGNAAGHATCSQRPFAHECCVIGHDLLLKWLRSLLHLKHQTVVLCYIGQPTAQSCPVPSLPSPNTTASATSAHMPTLQGQVPHVFGMTASPVNMNAQDSTTKMAQAVKQLEGNLDAEVGWSAAQVGLMANGAL